ncbi:MAG TPA: hypothetical protein PKN13_11540 [Accumulibacter sp.]|nr:hypothetical protein [Accumulibacter sp.]HNM75954.1 hypothetical protein [Accumulibacter sp.]HNO57824.1 hypothetical protein [Accumulibacter sp.]
MLFSGGSRAAPPSAANLAAEVGWGHESQTSPLVQISPQGTLIFIGGQRRLAGSHWRTNVSGLRDWPLFGDVRLALAGDLHVKRSLPTPDFDFLNASFSPALRTSLGEWGNIGVAGHWQHIDVAGAHFRNARSLQVDWTYADGHGGHWVIMADAGKNRHRGELSDLDSTSTTLLLQRHVEAPLPGIDAADLELYLVRERNDRGFDELASRSHLLRASLEHAWLGVTWSAGLAWQQARFATALLPTLPVRRDEAWTIELAAAVELAPGRTLRVDYVGVRNESNIALYQNRYRQISVALQFTW